MAWKKNPELNKLTSIRDAMQKVVEAEVKKTEETLKRFIKVLEIKRNHELGKKERTSTTD